MTGFSLKEIADRFRAGIYQHSDLVSAIGNINNPLLDMPLKNSLAMKAGVGSATFTRASTATYIDRYGVLKTAAIDEPRFEKEGYLNEGSSTNLLLQSEALTTAPWVTGGNCTYVANTTDTSDPYGTNLAEKMTINTGMFGYNTSTPYQDIVKSSVDVTYTLSAFCKPFGIYNSVRLNPTDANNNANNASVVISLIDGSLLTSASTSGTFTNASASSVVLANGWIRVALTFTTSTETTLRNRAFFPYVGIVNTISDGASGLYIFGAQLEALPFATSYIPTVASTVTRAADSNTVTLNNNFPSPLSTGSFIVDVVFTAIPTANSYILHYYGLWLRVDTTANVIQAATGTKSVSAVTPIAVNTPYRVCVVFSLTHQYLYINGLLQASVTRGAVTPVQSEVLYIGRASSHLNANPNVRISNLRTYDKQLTAQEVALA